jgi:hypothetical protein
MTESTDKIFVYDTINDGTHRYFASPLPHEYGFATGLPPEAVMGELTNGPDTITPKSFEQNPQFLQFLAAVLGKHSVDCPGLIAETERQQTGYVYILDQRPPTPDDGVPPEDIIGAVEIERGRMLRFHASPNYRLLTKNGFMQLDDWLHERLVAELVALPNVAIEGGAE